MNFLRGTVAIVFALIVSFVLEKYKTSIMLYIPKFKKKYIYEELKDKYSSYLAVYYLIVSIMYLILFLISNSFFQLVSSNIALNTENLLVVRKEYWIFPALIFSFHLSIILSRRLFRIILEENYEELIIYMFCRQRCFNLRDMILKIYSNVKLYKIYSKIISIVLSAYVFLGMLYYTDINEKTITVKKYLSLVGRKYSYSDVAFIFERYTWKEHNFTVIFKDGSCWNSENLLMSNDSEKDYKLMNFLEEKSNIKARELK